MSSIVIKDKKTSVYATSIHVNQYCATYAAFHFFVSKVLKIFELLMKINHIKIKMLKNKLFF